MMTRRDVLGSMLAVAAACTSGIAGCAAVPMLSAVPTRGRIRLPLREFEAAAGSRGALLVETPALNDPLLLLRNQEGNFVALSSRCTHQACRVKPARGFIICPCHGSTYDLAGNVVRGPARRALASYPARSVDEMIVIDLTREAAS